MFRSSVVGRFYVCIVYETKSNPLLHAVEIEPHQVVDIIHTEGDDPETSWKTLVEIANGRGASLDASEIERFLDVPVDYGYREIQQSLRNRFNRIDAPDYTVSICNHKRLKRLRKVSKAHTRSIEDAEDSLIAFRRYGMATGSCWQKIAWWLK